MDVFHKILSRWRMKFNAIFVRISNGVLGMKRNGAQKIDAKDVDAKDILKSDVWLERKICHCLMKLSSKSLAM